MFIKVPTVYLVPLEAGKDGILEYVNFANINRIVVIEGEDGLYVALHYPNEKIVRYTGIKAAYIIKEANKLAERSQNHD